MAIRWLSVFKHFNIFFPYYSFQVLFSSFILPLTAYWTKCKKSRNLLVYVLGCSDLKKNRNGGMNPQNPEMIQSPNYLLRFIFKLSPPFERELFSFLKIIKFILRLEKPAS